MQSAALTAEARARLLKALTERPQTFEFAQAVRLLARLWPERGRVGDWSDPAKEVARFAVDPSLSFPPSEIKALHIPGPDGQGGADSTTPSSPIGITTTFFGLTGPQGVLPISYTELAGARARQKDTALRDFLDMFHHRAISLLYRVWERSHFAAAYEADEEDRLKEHLLDVAGFGVASVRARAGVAEETIALYSGLLGIGARPAEGLERMVSDYFDVPASVEQFVGAWRLIEDGGQLSLGAEDDSGRLGTAIIGDAAWDVEAKVRIRLGPLTRERFDSFLPGGASHEVLLRLARLYANDEVGVDVQLVLRREETPPSILDAAPSRTSGRLGRGMWLVSKPMARDPDETQYALC